jgi:hypothetical protein
MGILFEILAGLPPPVITPAALFVSKLRKSMTLEQKKKLLKAKIAVALQDELGRVPTKEEINQVFLLTRVMYKAVLGLHFKRKEQKQTGQLAIF